MGKIFCLTGKSASGKDAIYQRLMADEATGLLPVVSYTTRPIRDGEEEGREYHFCSLSQMEQMEAQGRLIERRTYHTVHGDWHYFTADDGQIGLSEHSYLMVATPEQVHSLRAYFGSAAVAAVFIYVEDGERLERALRRERKQEQPKYAELCRRFLADEADFAPEKLAEAGIEDVIENVDLMQTLADVRDWIGKAL